MISRPHWMKIKHGWLKLCQFNCCYANCPDITELVVTTILFHCCNFWSHPLNAKPASVIQHGDRILPCLYPRISQHFTALWRDLFQCNRPTQRIEGRQKPDATTQPWDKGTQRLSVCCIAASEIKSESCISSKLSPQDNLSSFSLFSPPQSKM